MSRILVLLFFCPLIASAQPPDYYSPESVLLFADHLYREHDYLRAAYEYERYRFLRSGDDPAGERVLLKAGKAFQCGGAYDRSLELFAEIMTAAGDNEIRRAAIYETGLTYFRMARYEESLLLLQDQPRGHLSADADLLIAADLMMLGRWNQAVDLLDSHESPASEPLRAIAAEGTALRRKSPLAAAVFSTMVPGTGKIYAGAYGDGIQSLILIGLLGTLAGLSFRADGVTSVRGWIYGSIGGVLHVGNIYGSAVAAGRYNRLREEALFEGVRKRIPVCSRLPVAP
jgi:TM2 domain-containing membrane protein YozV